MRASTAAGIMLIWAAVFSSCAPTRIWTSVPGSAVARNEQFTVRFTPSRTGTTAFNRFELEIANTGSRPLEVDWIKTRYLYQNRPAGGFIFEGLDETNVNSPPPDVLPPGAELRKSIAPLRFIAWKGYKPGYRDLGSFSAGPLPQGPNGILLVVRQADRIFEEKLSVSINIETH